MERFLRQRVIKGLIFFFRFQIKRYEKTDSIEERKRIGKEIYDKFIMKELLANPHVQVSFMCINTDERMAG